MKTFLATAAAMIVLAAPALADPLEGVWVTTRDDNGNFGMIEVKPCGDALCGTLIRSYGPDDKAFESENNGRLIISETVATGGGEYRGKVYSPDRDKTYKSKLQLNGDTLSVSGCVFGICRDGGSWERR